MLEVKVLESGSTVHFELSSLLAVSLGLELQLF